MRKYQVIVTPEAQAGIRSAFDYIRKRAPLNAARWLQGLYQQIDTLERCPERCGFARERRYLEEDLRQLVLNLTALCFKSRSGTARSMCCTYATPSDAPWEKLERNRSGLSEDRTEPTAKKAFHGTPGRVAVATQAREVQIPLPQRGIGMTSYNCSVVIRPSSRAARSGF